MRWSCCARQRAGEAKGTSTAPRRALFEPEAIAQPRSMPNACWETFCWSRDAHKRRRTCCGGRSSSHPLIRMHRNSSGARFERPEILPAPRGLSASPSLPRPGAMRPVMSLQRCYSVAGNFRRHPSCSARSSRRSREFPDAHANFGIVLALGGHPAKALPYLDRAVSLRPDDPGLLMNRALCLRELDRHPEAERSLRTALVLRDDLSIRINLANILRETGRPREALELVASFASAERETADAKCVMAKSLQDLSELDAAKVAFDAAVASAPEDADVRLSRAMHLLYAGDFGSGWDEYEWRFKSRENPRRRFRPGGMGCFRATATSDTCVRRAGIRR